MKKLYILTLLLIASFSSNAQYTITASIFPVVGETSKTWDADTTGIVVGPAGTNQTWSYFGVTVPSTVTAKTTTYVNVNTAPNYTAYPSATMANTSDNVNFDMQSYGSNLTSYGTTSSTLSVIYGNPLTFLAIPFSYGQASADTYSTMYVSGGSSYVINGSYTTTADGWGTLNMPGLKTYTNTLRIKLQGYTTLSMTTGTTVTTFTQTSLGYIHISPASKNSILEINTNTTTIKSGTATVVQKDKKVTVNDIIFTGIKENSISSIFSIYPNPSSNKEVTLNLMPLDAENYSATVYNSLGQEVQHMNFGEFCPGKYSVKVDLHDLNTGLYYIKLKGKEQEGIQKLIIE